MMKYPALTRVFAVVLCIFAALLLLSAAEGIRNAVKDKAAAAHSYSLLSSRLDEYETLETKLAEAGGSESAGMDATGDLRVSVDMVIRVTKSVTVPMGLGFIICDCFAMIAWVGIVLKGMLPVNKITLICNPVFIALLGQLMNYVAEGLDSGFESLGWLLMYLVCAMSLVGKEECL